MLIAPACCMISTALEPGAFTAAWAAGQAMTLEQMIAGARELTVDQQIAAQ